MLRYVITRILWLIPIIIVVSFIVYTLMDLAPGTIVDSMITDTMTQEDVDALMRAYDLDKPMIYRYGKYMLNLVQGNLGVSDHTRISVWDTYISRLPNTLLLAFASLVFGAVISIPLGIFAARRAGSLVDNSVTLLTLLGMSMPAFWLGLLLLMLFSLHLGWLPGGGNREGFRSLILPAVCSGFILMASSARQTRSSMLEVLNADYLRTARAKGVPEEAVIRKHALGNAWIPILTTIGTSLSVSLAGSAVIESVFSWSGVGRATVDAVMARDVTATCGLVIMTTILYVVLQLVVDLLYAFVDPRIKSQYANIGRKKKQAVSTAQGSIAARPEEPAAVVSMEPRSEILKYVFLDSPVAAGDSEFETAAAQYEPALSIQGGIIPAYADSGVPGPERNGRDGAYEVSGASYAAESGEVGVSLAAEQEHDPDTRINISSATAKDAGALATKKYKKRSRFREIAHSIRRNKSAMAGLIIIIALFLILIGSLFISYESVTATSTANRFRPPEWGFLFGGDNLGRDTFLRTIYGSRYSLVIGFGSAGIATVLGIILGALAGYYGGRVDDIVMRASDVLASIPGLLLGMVIVTVLGQSLQNLIIAVGVTAIPVFIRITRASVLSVRNQEFVEAARAIGIPNLRIVFSQVLPNGLSPIIVTFTASLGLSIIVGASLSFLGFGVPVPHPEWGALVSAGRNYIRIAPYLTTFPGLFIMITVLAFNLLGDGLRDALDPKLKR